MTLLCIETSARPSVIGITRDGNVLAEAALDVRDHLRQDISAVIEKAGVTAKDITAIALGIGPGSFTGLRVGTAFAKGFARGSGCMVWPVSSLKSFAANAQGMAKTVCAISPARKEQVHLGHFDGTTLKPVITETVVHHKDLANYLSTNSLLIGPGVFALSSELKKELKNFIPEDNLHRAQIKMLAQLAAAEWKDKTPPDIQDLVPAYGLDFGK